LFVKRLNIPKRVDWNVLVLELFVIDMLDIRSNSAMIPVEDVFKFKFTEYTIERGVFAIKGFDVAQYLFNQKLE
jgi:hypothetical protein